jgi:sporulation-control protein
MDMFKRVLAKLGVGSATVNLVLDKDEYTLGDTVEGQILVEGGTVEQRINKIDVDLVLSVRVKEKVFSHTVDSASFHTPFRVAPSEKKVFPFTFSLPNNLLISGNTVWYDFVTRLDIADGVDHSDRDPVRILPPERLNRVLEALGRLGFREKHDSRSFDGYVQEFEFFPTDFMRGRIEELEFVASLEEDGIRLLLEVDLRTLFGGEKELKREVFLENSLLEDVTALSDHFRELIGEMAENPGAFSGFRFDHHPHHAFSRYGGAIGGLAAGVLGGLVLSELVEEVAEGAEDLGEVLEDVGDFFDFGGED